jgi:hypothetical protein
MDSNLGNALSGLLLLHGGNDSNNDRKDSSQCDSHSYHFSHDSLLQSIKKCCIEWMMNTTIPGETTHVYKRWVKPENGLNDHFGSKWWWRPIGNSPELMPLVNSLNQDVHKSVRRHTVMSLTIQDCNNKDDRLITMATPKEMAHS